MLKQVMRASVTALALALSASMPVWAVSPPGTVIDNQAYLSFTMDGMNLNLASPRVSFTVLELVDARVQWNDAGPIGVSSPDAGKAPSFKVWNLGNARHAFTLHATALSDQVFTPELSAPALYIENGLQAGLQASGPLSDSPLGNASAIDLDPQESKTIYVAADIPADLMQESRGGILLEARSGTVSVQGRAAGSLLPNAGTGGVDLVVGKFGGAAQDSGYFVVSGTVVKTAKSVVRVEDPTGGSKAVSGSLVSYEIRISAQGPGHLSDITFVDALPAQLSYVPNSLILDGNAISDTGRVVGETITVGLGSKSAPFVSTLQLKARIK